MKTEVSTLSNFITKLEAEFLNGEEAIQLKGGFATPGEAKAPMRYAKTPTVLLRTIVLANQIPDA